MTAMAGLHRRRRPRLLRAALRVPPVRAGRHVGRGAAHRRVRAGRAVLGQLARPAGAAAVAGRWSVPRTRRSRSNSRGCRSDWSRVSRAGSRGRRDPRLPGAPRLRGPVRRAVTTSLPRCRSGRRSMGRSFAAVRLLFAVRGGATPACGDPDTAPADGPAVAAVRDGIRTAGSVRCRRPAGERHSRVPPSRCRTDHDVSCLRWWWDEQRWARLSNAVDPPRPRLRCGRGRCERQRDRSRGTGRSRRERGAIARGRRVGGSSCDRRRAPHR